MMNCEQAKSLLTKYLLEDLDEAQASEVRAHIETCENCSVEAKEIEPTLDLLREALADTAPAPARLDVDRHADIYAEEPSGMGRIIHIATGDYPVLRRLASALVICFMIALLAAMALPSFVKSRSTARGAASMNNLRQVGAAIEMYKMDNNGQVPKSLNEISFYMKGEKDVGVLSGSELSYNFEAAEADVVAVDQGDEGTAFLYGDGRVAYEKKAKPKSGVFNWLKMGKSEEASLKAEMSVIEPEAVYDAIEDFEAVDQSYAVPKGGERPEARARKADKTKDSSVIFAMPNLDGTEVDMAVDELTANAYTGTRTPKPGKLGKGGAPGWPEGALEAAVGVDDDHQALPPPAQTMAGSRKAQGRKMSTARGGGSPVDAKHNIEPEPNAAAPKPKTAPAKRESFDDGDGMLSQWSVSDYESPAIVKSPVITKSLDQSRQAVNIAEKPASMPSPVTPVVPDAPAEEPAVFGGAPGASYSVSETARSELKKVAEKEAVADSRERSSRELNAPARGFTAAKELRRDESSGEGEGFLSKVPVLGRLLSGSSSAKASVSEKAPALNFDGIPVVDESHADPFAAGDSVADGPEEHAKSKKKEVYYRYLPGFKVGGEDASRSQNEEVAPAPAAESVAVQDAAGLSLESTGSMTSEELKRRLNVMTDTEKNLTVAGIALERGQLTQADRYFEKAAEAAKEEDAGAYLEARLGAAEVDRVTKDYDDALKGLENLEELAQGQDKGRVKAARAKILTEIEDYDGAAQEIEEVLAADPDNKDALILRGKILAQKRDLIEATEIEIGAAEKDEEDQEDQTGTRFIAYGVNPVINVSENAFSTFSIDVDTASYTLTRNYIIGGSLPPAESVRTEEVVNFFDYDYMAPTHRTFAVYAEAAPSKFGRGKHLLKIGVKGKRLGREEQRRAVLTFLIDTSGSMEKPDRIGLVKKSLKMLVEKLNDSDLVSIVQYDSRARLVLSHTEARNRQAIIEAIDSLQCSGSTNLEQGLNKAYEAAARGFVSKGENRVLILSDGVANLGNLDADALLAKVSNYRKQGIYCSVFGLGMGTYDDVMLETLANKGDGTYAYLDSEEEAKRLFVDDLSATLNTIAKDVKIQVEFNERLVKDYRQLGYENRQLTKEQFRDDTVDAGEVGSGQSVTALYELGMKEAISKRLGADPIATVRVRYRRTDNDAVEEIEIPVTFRDFTNDFNKTDARFRLAACAAEFAEVLRGSPYAQGSDYRDVSAALRPVALELNLDQRVQEFLRLTTSAPGMARGQ